MPAISVALPTTMQPSAVPADAEAIPRAVAAAPARRSSSPHSPAANAPADATNAPPPAPAFADRVVATGAASTAPVPASRSADAPVPTAAHHPTVVAQPGRIGREMGVEIARRVHAGGEELTVRLNPVEMGRIEVRLSFDKRGSLRALVSAESAAALDMLRRDSADLGRALADAGVRADAGSFRFDTRSGGEGGQFQGHQQTGPNRRRASAYAKDPADPDPVYRPLRASGRVDLMA